MMALRVEVFRLVDAGDADRHQPFRVLRWNDAADDGRHVGQVGRPHPLHHLGDQRHV